MDDTNYIRIYLIVVILLMLTYFIEDNMEYNNYPVISYRYFETKKILSNEEKVEVIYETDSETEKMTFSVYSIKIGKKTEVVVQGNNVNYCLYMTKDDYESLFSSQ